MGQAMVAAAIVGTGLANRPTPFALAGIEAAVGVHAPL
jgi:hypothetical protein